MYVGISVASVDDGNSYAPSYHVIIASTYTLC